MKSTWQSKGTISKTKYEEGVMKLVFTFCLVLCVCGIVQAEKINGSEFPEKLKVEGDELLLNGGGTRTRYFVSIYNSGLYLKEKINKGDIVVNEDKSMAVRMQFVYNLVKKEKIISVWNECFENVTDGNVKPIKKEIESFCGLFGFEDVKSGDVFDLVYIPSKGVAVSKNSKHQGVVKGLAFKKALFSVWFGNKPIQQNLKMAMLGEK